MKEPPKFSLACRSQGGVANGHHTTPPGEGQKCHKKLAKHYDLANSKATSYSEQTTAHFRRIVGRE
jgi:hypothetical protein